MGISHLNFYSCCKVTCLFVNHGFRMFYSNKEKSLLYNQMSKRVWSAKELSLDALGDHPLTMKLFVAGGGGGGLGSCFVSGPGFVMNIYFFHETHMPWSPAQFIHSLGWVDDARERREYRDFLLHERNLRIGVPSCRNTFFAFLVHYLFLSTLCFSHGSSQLLVGWIIIRGGQIVH